MPSSVKPKSADRAPSAEPTSVRKTASVFDSALILCGLGVVAACALAARTGAVGPVELRVFRLINGLPEWLSKPMQVAQLLGVLGVGPIIAVVAVLLRRFRLAIAALLVTAAKLAAERLVWALVQRSRPGVTIPDAILRGGVPTHGLSFVSGHVTLVTGLAVVVSPYLPRRFRLIPWVVVAVVAFARIYLGAHAPLDVLGGLGLGAFIGGAVDLIVRRRPPSGNRRRTIADQTRSMGWTSSSDREDSP